MAKNEEIKEEYRFITDDEIPLALRSKLKKQVQAQSNELQDEYSAVLSAGNTERAIELLTELIYTDDNTPKRRKELRELYSKQCPSREDAEEYGYLKVAEIRSGVNDTPINGAKRDYIDYLQLQAQKYDYNNDVDDAAVNLARKIADLLRDDHDVKNTEMIQWLIWGTDYESAWEILQSSSTESDLIKFAIKAFQAEYDKCKKCANVDSDYEAYRQVTWILASLFQKNGDIPQAIQKFIDCDNYRNSYRSAYELVDIHSVETIRFALEEFKGHDDNYVKVLSAMANRHDDLEQMYTVTSFPNNFAMKWWFMSFFYAIYRLKTLFGKKITRLVIVFCAIVLCVIPEKYIMLTFLGFETFVLGYDINLHEQWINLHKFYEGIIEAGGDHPQLTPVREKFSKNLSTEIGTHKKLCVFVLWNILFMILIGYTIYQHGSI